jgi:alpha-L-fucosidase 2
MRANLLRWGGVAALLLAVSPVVRAQGVTVRRDLDMARVLSRCDMVWDRMPTRWEDGPFVGNGLVGVMVYGDGAGLRLDVGRTDVFDHRPVPAGPHPTVGQYLRCRLPIGHLTLRTVGKVTACHLRLDVYSAELTGRLTTDHGSIDLRLLAPASDPATVLLDATPHGDERPFGLSWHADVSQSPRVPFVLAHRLKVRKLTEAQWRHDEHLEDYAPNPPAVRGGAGDTGWSTQPLSAGGAYETAWRDVAAGPARAITVSVGCSVRSASAAHDQAIAGLAAGDGPARAAAVEAHRRWWHAFWPESFVSVPDDRLSQFYWLQQYKLASACRAGRPALDLYGPWPRPETPWPYYCWNMNVQVAYSPVYTANRLELGENLCDFMDRNAANLATNTGGADEAGLDRCSGPDGLGTMGTEIGDLPWALHNVYQQYRWAGDDDGLVHRLCPLLRRSMNVYLHRLQPGDDGRLHLPPSYSPEFALAPDCNYDLSLLRWGLGVLLRYAGPADAPADERARWTDVLAKLTPYPADANGLMIGRGLPLDVAHRHFSHLMMAFPLRTMSPDDPANRALIRTSLDHWMGVPGTDRQGFTYAGAASIAALLGDGNGGLSYLNAALDRLLFSNTMYAEGCIESPFGLCDALQNLLLESDDRGVSVFPAVPDAWADCAFDDLRAEGAFLVSAARSGGRTAWARVKSLRGEPLAIRPGLSADCRFDSDDPAAAVRWEAGVAHVTLAAGRSIVFYPGDRPATLTVAAAAVADATPNHYGLHGVRSDARP